MDDATETLGPPNDPPINEGFRRKRRQSLYAKPINVSHIIWKYYKFAIYINCLFFAGNLGALLRVQQWQHHSWIALSGRETAPLDGTVRCAIKLTIPFPMNRVVCLQNLVGHCLSAVAGLLLHLDLADMAEVEPISSAGHVCREVHAHRSDPLSGDHHLSVHQDQAKPV